LPAGSLREAASALDQVDLVAANITIIRGGRLLESEKTLVRSLLTWNRPTGSLRFQTVCVVADVGNPARLIPYLRKYGLQVIKHIFLILISMCLSTLNSVMICPWW